MFFVIRNDDESTDELIGEFIPPEVLQHHVTNNYDYQNEDRVCLFTYSFLNLLILIFKVHSPLNGWM